MEPWVSGFCRQCSNVRPTKHFTSIISLEVYSPKVGTENGDSEVAEQSCWARLRAPLWAEAGSVYLGEIGRARQRV